MDAFYLLMGMHSAGFILQSTELLVKGYNGRNQRTLSFTTFLVSIFIIAYHASLCLILKRISLFPTSSLTCKIYSGRSEPLIYFGEIQTLFKLEFLVFCAQIFAMPFCVLRMKIGEIVEIDEMTYH